jgi:hypothetical protein
MSEQNTQPVTAPAVASGDLLACLRRMRESIQKRTAYYQGGGDDPYQINTGMLVTMLELDGIIGEQVEYLGRQANK